MSNPESLIQENKSEKFDQNKSFPLDIQKVSFIILILFLKQIKELLLLINIAHERIVYEKMKSEIYNKKIKTQILLIPVIIDIDRSTLNAINDSIDKVKGYGLVIEPFGSDSIVVREIPGILSDCDVKNLTLDIINELIENDDATSVEEQINKICSKMACHLHGSIRAGREMQLDEMNDLLRKMESTPFSGQCNHGRPAYVELKLSDIERLFGRK